MKLLRAQVTNYKSIDDSGWVMIDNVTCLVGKNESGKTAFLQALQKLSPVRGKSGKFDPVLEYPKKGYSRYKSVHETAPAIVVRAEFELADEEVREIEAAFGAGVLKSRRVTAHKNYKNVQFWLVELDESATIRHLLNNAKLPGEIASEADQTASSRH